MDSQPSFTTWTTLFFLVAAFGFLLTFILLLSKRIFTKNWPIIAIIFGFSCIISQYVFFWSGHYLHYPYLYFFDHVWYLLFGPLLYQYITTYYHKEFKPNWFHYLPAGILAIMTTYYFIRTGGSFNSQEVVTETMHYFFNQLQSPWVAGISLLIYTFTTKNLIEFYRSQAPSEYEMTRDRWATLLVNLFSAFIIAYFSYFILVRFEFFNPIWDYGISLSMAISIYSIGYMVYKEPSIFNGGLFSSLFLKKTQVHEFSEETKQELYDTLMNHMAEQKPYLDSEIRLVKLADHLGMSSHVVSKLINEGSGKNFNQFINDYRLMEAERLLRENNETYVKNIYYDVGFNNKATFYRAFKAKYHSTPIAYKRKFNQER